MAAYGRTGLLNPGLLNPALLQTGLLGTPQQPAMVPGAQPRPMSVAQPSPQGPSFMQGIMNNPDVLLALSGGLLQAGAPSTDPGRGQAMLGQTLQQTGGLLGQKAQQRKQNEAMQGLLGSGSFTPQQKALMTAFPNIGAQAAVQSAFTPGKQPGMVNMMNPQTQDVKTVPEGSPQMQELAQAGYALTGNVEVPKPERPLGTKWATDNKTGNVVPVTDTELQREPGRYSPPPSKNGITINNDGGIPVGYSAERDDNGNVVRLVAIPGGPADLERQTVEAAAANKGTNEDARSSVVNDDISRALTMLDEQPDLMSGLMGTTLAIVPGTPAHDLSQKLMTIRANQGFDRLSQMRAESPTGGALGAVSGQEMELLTSASGSIAQSQSAEELAYNLKRYANIYNDIIHGKGNGPQRYDIGGTTQEQPTQKFDWDPVTGELVPSGGMPSSEGVR